jgi:MFS family permease
VFGHFGDRIGRKATLVAALLTMGVSTVAIGLLPTYAQIGIAAPALLALCRFGQGLGLGGEWGGAVLLAVENAPPGKRAWYGMFPQLGAPIGFLCSAAVFIVLDVALTDADFRSWGWRVPFLASAALVGVGLWVRLKLNETPAFRATLERHERVRVPFFSVLRQQPRDLVLGSLAATTTFVLFYLMTVFTLSWGTSQLGYTRTEFLLLQMVGMVFFGLTIPLSAVIADQRGRRAVLIVASVAILAYGLVFAPLFTAGSPVAVALFLSIGLALMGLTYGPLGTALAELFPTALRYTGSSLAFNVAGILGASLAPSIATKLATSYGLPYVGYYLAGAAVVSLAAFILLKRPAGID